MKKNYYDIEKNLNKIYKGEPTYFLDPLTYNIVSKKLKNINYNIYSPYKDSEKVIIYTDKLPNIKLIEIISYDKLTHSEIMGSLFGFQITNEMFGDIIIYNNHYYVPIIANLYEMFIRDFQSVGNHSVTIKEVDISIIDNYQKAYEDIELIVGSLRIDSIVAKLIGSSRDNIKKRFLDGDIILNYEECTKYTTNLNIGDIFSIRRNGKYKLDNIIGKTKKDNYIINIKKYISNN